MVWFRGGVGYVPVWTGTQKGEPRPQPGVHRCNSSLPASHCARLPPDGGAGGSGAGAGPLRPLSTLVLTVVWYAAPI